MPKVLTNLKVSEVSLVDRGAGEGVKVKLWKRDPDPAGDPGGFFRKLFAGLDDGATARRSRRNYEFVYGKRGRADDRDDDEDEPRSAREREAFMPWLENDRRDGRRDTIDRNLLRELTHDSALSPRERAHLTGRAKRQEASVEHIAVRVSKAINFVGRSHVSEHDMTDLIFKYAQRSRRAGETPAQAFCRVYQADTSEGLGFRKAVEIAKSSQRMAMAPRVSGGRRRRTIPRKRCDSLRS